MGSLYLSAALIVGNAAWMVIREVMLLKASEYRIASEYTPGLWWCTWCQVWGEIGRAEALTGEIKLRQDELLKIKRKYIKRRGRIKQKGM